MTPAVVSVSECAGMLGICSRTLRRWVASGAYPLPRVTVGGRQKFIRADVDRLVRSNLGVGRRKVNR